MYVRVVMAALHLFESERGFGSIFKHYYTSFTERSTALDSP